MFAKNRLTLAVTAAVGMAAAGLVPSDRALAQGANDTMLEEVVVTGSRISRNPESYLGGMAIAAGDDIEKIGSYNTLDLLQKLPAIGSQGTGRNQSNGGRGANFVEIHNLEAERTLVLMDGRRVVPTIRDSLGLAVDMQSFPANMIDRIEVLADGASAVYGSDALARRWILRASRSALVTVSLQKMAARPRILACCSACRVPAGASWLAAPMLRRRTSTTRSATGPKCRFSVRPATARAAS